jgi:hypothetical protein
VEAFHLDLGGGDFGAVTDEVGLELGDFDLNELLLRGDDIALINGDFLDVTGHTRFQLDLLPRSETGGQADPAVDGALLRLRGRKVEREGAGGEEDEGKEETHGWESGLDDQFSVAVGR